jgi:hemolysin activation/secretion protein
LTVIYRNRGYVLSAVVVPPQTIRDGVVRLQAVEGYVGKVDFDPGFTPTARMREQAEAIARERPLTIKTLERQLLLINELAGVTAQAYFAPGTDTGEALLTIKAIRRPVSGFVGIQNRVSRLLGDVSIEGRVTLNNPLGLDDSHSLLLQTTNRGRLRSAAYVYNQPLGTDGLALNLFLANIESKIVSSGAEIKSESTIGTLGLSYPLIRGRTESLRLRARLNVYNGKQDFLSGLLEQEDHARALRLGASWDRTDGSGVNFADVEVSKGITALGATSNGAANAQRADADYGFTKLNFYAGRLQRLGGNFSLQASVQGQWTDDPLPPSERAPLGGELILRAFDAGELIGDRAWAGKLELRYEPSWIEGGRISLYGFAEAGRTVTLQAALPDIVQKGGTTGIGVRGTLASNANFYAEVAVPHRRNVAYNNSRRARFFAGLSYEF